ncbi:hypothetical protein H6G06_11235 [Anabaena sphaerica FACHB-251]|uniref:Deoxycytidine triphosphate deaminase n=1 Tax=Anabaena sphaerica FACHB-251 TaxID=2692883 RepID=A0A927A212_9NOST|nr:hypothetical protein [Anabaena sphaerica]MBD2294050.1 hypothetical protein [Anabaena sphaerica FACHB-251]
MSVLSDRDIIRELGRGILFHPLKPSPKSKFLKGSIRASDLCFTASENAYSMGLQQTLSIQTESTPDKPNEEQKFFYILPRDTALVWTDESVWLSNQFRGSLYSVVEQASEGLGHIGTRVNPCWAAVLCIPLHNLSDKPLRIDVRNVNKPIAYLAIEKLSSRSSITPNSDNAGRLDLLQGKPNCQAILEYYSSKNENSWMTNREELKERMLKSDEYQELKKGVKDTLLSFLGSSEDTRWTRGGIIAATLFAGISALFTGLAYFNPPNPNPNNNTNPSSPK